MSQQLTRVHGAVDAARAAVAGGLTTVEGVHAAIAHKPFSLLGYAPGVGDVSEIVRFFHDGITALVYGGLRAAVSATAGAARVATTLAAPPDDELRTGSAADLTIAAVNGFAGDYFARTGNPLATEMGLRHRGRDLGPERDALTAAFPEASPRLAVFVHGLSCNESLWRLHSERHYGNRRTTYGSRLQADLGYTPLYVRYNTGLHISDNGRRLARLLERLVAAWPTAVEEMALIGHSMGGLVARSACHYGGEEGLDWVRSVRHVVYLGSPHHGAPLEKAANVAAWLLGRTDVTLPFAAIFNARSAGIKDLRFGSLLDADWKDADLDALLADRTGEVPLLEGANHYFVAATITRDARHPLGVAVGDLLVRRASASGRGRFRRLQFRLEHGRHFGAMTHLELLNHPDVYEQMRRWLDPGGRRGAPSQRRDSRPTP
jgi:hypothetical protein